MIQKEGDKFVLYSNRGEALAKFDKKSEAEARQADMDFQRRKVRRQMNGGSGE